MIWALGGAIAWAVTVTAGLRALRHVTRPYPPAPERD